MANYNFVIDNNTNPYDYASALIPIFTNYGNKWDTKYEKAKLELLDRLALKQLIELEDDEKLLELYSLYDSKFNDFFDSFNRGYDSNTEKLGLEANKLYKESIIPIEREMVKREKKLEAQRAFKEAHPEVMYDRDFRDVKISEMLENPNLDYKTYDGSIIKNSIADMVKSLGSSYTRILNNPNNAGKNNTVDQYLLSGIQKGWTLNEIIQGASNDKNAPKALRLIGENVRNLYDYNNLSDELKDFIDTKIAEGYYLGVGQFDTLWLSNHNFQSEADKNDSLNDPNIKYPRMESQSFDYTGKNADDVSAIKDLLNFNKKYLNIPKGGFVVTNLDGTIRIIDDVYEFNVFLKYLKDKSSEKILDHKANKGKSLLHSTDIKYTLSEEGKYAKKEKENLEGKYSSYIVDSDSLEKIQDHLNTLSITNPKQVSDVLNNLLYQSGTITRYQVLGPSDKSALQQAQHFLRTSKYELGASVKVIDPTSSHLSFTSNVPKDLLSKGNLVGIVNNPIYNYDLYKEYFNDNGGLTILNSDYYVEAILEYENPNNKEKKLYTVVIPSKAFGDKFSDQINKAKSEKDNVNFYYNEYMPFVDLHTPQDDEGLTLLLLLYNNEYNNRANMYDLYMNEVGMKARNSFTQENTQ